jgi:hypothetical protein
MAQVSKKTDEIRQIQMLTTLLLCLRPGSKLHVLFEHALRAESPGLRERLARHGRRVDDVSHDGLKDWLEAVFCHGGLSVAEQGAIDWQTEPNNIVDAVKDLEEAESTLGFKIVIESK